MEIEELRIAKDGDDLVEHWLFSREPGRLEADINGDIAIPDSLLTQMRQYYESQVEPKAADYPLLGALSALEHKFFPTYAQFGKMLEVRYVNALKNVIITGEL